MVFVHIGPIDNIYHYQLSEWIEHIEAETQYRQWEILFWNKISQNYVPCV